ncbi:methyltransferase [Streptomyces sp. NPDC093149]|uniref:methyltransferase n=1 Tax=Streptomyces sp. NPDC093149 TaxID=3366031 RepID=UPI00381B9EE7
MPSPEIPAPGARGSDLTPAPKPSGPTTFHSDPSPGPTPDEAVDLVARMATLFTPWALRTGVTLGLFDLVGTGLGAPALLAERTGADKEAVRRLLRHLANLKLLDRGPDGYRLTALGAVLTSGHPSGLARGLDQSDAWAEASDLAVPGLISAVTTGRPSWSQAAGAPFWQSLATDPQLAASFDTAMSGHADAVGPWLATVWNWSTASHVADVGGGTGSTLRDILVRHPHLQGTLIDLPGTVSRAEAKLGGDAALAGRVTLSPGSFFDPLPDGHDILVLAHVLHDWGDDDCVRLLRRCAEAVADGGAVLVVDRVVHDSAIEGQLPVSQRDLAMLVLLGGKERTAEEFRMLGKAAGLGLRRSPLAAPHEGLCLLEFGRDGGVDR